MACSLLCLSLFPNISPISFVVLPHNTGQFHPNSVRSQVMKHLNLVLGFLLSEFLVFWFLDFDINLNLGGGFISPIKFIGNCVLNDV